MKRQRQRQASPCDNARLSSSELTYMCEATSMSLIRPSEHEEQRALFEWASWRMKQLPELEMLYAIPNGGLRSKATAGRLKAEGVRAGVFDISLDVARGGFHGLRIELKSHRGRPSKHQLEWHERYRRYGYYPAVCVGWEAAKAVIERYLSWEN